MGKPTGFLEYEREEMPYRAEAERVCDFDDLHTPLDDAARRQQAARCMDCGVPFCHSGVMMNGMMTGCPLHNLIPEWNELIYRGEYERAWRRLEHTAPFPEITGRVCPALCEGACACGRGGMPVTVRDNERTLADMAFEKGWIKPHVPAVRNGRRIAVIGSGPAGLAAAMWLNRRGCDVTVLERQDRPGGLLMYGIPNMKLSKAVVERRTALLSAEGVHFKCGVDASDIDVAREIMRDHDAVIICAGTGVPRPLNVEGSDLGGVHYALEYLGEATHALLDGHRPTIDARGKHVLVIGGGDTGTDCVGTALRQGAVSVDQFEIMPAPPAARAQSNPWPEYPRVLKTDYAQREYIALHGGDPRSYLRTVTALRGEAGHVKSALTSAVEWTAEPDGRRTMRLSGDEREYEAELVLIAMGFVGVSPELAAAFGLTPDARGRIGGDDHRTSNPRVFTAGDSRIGQSLVVRAIADGIDGAKAVMEMLGNRH